MKPLSLPLILENKILTMELKIAKWFYQLVSYLDIPEVSYFNDSRETVHKILKLIYKAKLQIQPEVIWNDDLLDDDLHILKTNIKFAVIEQIQTKRNDYHLQIGHPMTVLLYKGLDRANNDPLLFELFVDQYLQETEILEYSTQNPIINYSEV